MLRRSVSSNQTGEVISDLFVNGAVASNELLASVKSASTQITAMRKILATRNYARRAVKENGFIKAFKASQPGYLFRFGHKSAKFYVTSISRLRILPFFVDI